MYQLQSYLRVRRAVKVEGMSIREASRVFGLHRVPVPKMLANASCQIVILGASYRE